MTSQIEIDYDEEEEEGKSNNDLRGLSTAQRYQNLGA